MEKFFLTREEACKALNLSLGTLDILLRTRQIKPARRGRRVFVPASEVARYAALLARHGSGYIWPPKRGGKTTRDFAPTNSPTRSRGANHRDV
jgi:excisionase family DNA binding protein